jgi:hypothetical protein
MVRDIGFYPETYKLSEYKKKRFDSINMNNEDLEKVVAFIKDCKLDVENIYIDTSNFLSYTTPYYFDGIFLNGINYSFINKKEMYKPILQCSTDAHVEETLYDYYKREFLNIREIYMESYKNGEPCQTAVDKKFYPLLYGIFFDKMSNDDKFYEFLSIYKFCEYPKNYFTLEDIENIAATVPKNLIDKRKSYSIVKNEYVNVYRGQESYSSSGKGALSWTTDLKIAQFFASRFEGEGLLLSGRVHIKDIIAIFDEEYYDDGESDSEKEVLVCPNTVTNIRVSQYSPN